MADTKAATRRRTAANVWTDEEKAAMQASARERKRQARLSPEQEREAGEQEVRAKIAEMPEPERTMATRVHAIVTSTAPNLTPRTYYGMPAYAREGKTVCFFRPASKFKERYSIFGFEQAAKLDDGTMWPTAFAITQLTPQVEARIAELVKKAAG